MNMFAGRQRPQPGSARLAASPVVPSHLFLPVISYAGVAALSAGTVKVLGVTWVTVGLLGWTVALPMAMLVTVCSRGGAGVAQSMGGVPADPRLTNLAREAASAVGIPPPAAVFSVDAKEPNAFAASSLWSGEPTVAVTKGLRDILTDREMKAVLAHEMGHLKHRDVVSNMHVAIAAVGFGGIYETGRTLLRSSGNSNKKSRKDKDGSSSAGLGLALMGAGFATQATAHVIRLAASRNAELKADRAAAEAFGASALISALEKIDASSARRPRDLSESKVGKAFAFAMISDGPSRTASASPTAPLSSGKDIGRLLKSARQALSTHPSLETRVDALRQGVADGALER